MLGIRVAMVEKDALRVDMTTDNGADSDNFVDTEPFSGDYELVVRN